MITKEEMGFLLEHYRNLNAARAREIDRLREERAATEIRFRERLSEKDADFKSLSFSKDMLLKRLARFDEEEKKDGKILVWKVRHEPRGSWLAATTRAELADAVIEAAGDFPADCQVEIEAEWWTRDQINEMPEFSGF